MAIGREKRNHFFPVNEETKNIWRAGNGNTGEQKRRDGKDQPQTDCLRTEEKKTRNSIRLEKPTFHNHSKRGKKNRVHIS